MAKKIFTLPRIAKSVTTLYIDDISLKLLVARGSKVTKCATLPLESGLVSDGVVIDRAKVAAKIKELFKAQRVRGKKVITGLSGLHCLFRVITLPQLPESMLTEAISFEAKTVLPVPLEEFYISWQIIPTQEQETQVFLAALPRNDTDALIKTLREAGIKPYLMDLAPLTLARVIGETTAIIVDVRSTEVDIVIVVEGVPQLIRTLHLSSKAQSLQEKLPKVREELKRTIKFYNSSHPGKPLEPSLPIFASGELGENPQARQSLADELNYSVLPLAPPLMCPEDLAPTRYMVNIGLALKKLPPERRASLSLVNLNVLPEVYQPKPPSLTKVLTRLGIIVAILLIAYLFMLIQDTAADKASLQSKVDATTFLVQKRQENVQLQKAEIAELESKVAELEVTRDAFTGVLHDFSWHQEMVNGDLKLITLALPSGVDLSRITHTGDTLKISGMSPGEEEVLAYASDLRDSGRFSQVTTSAMKQTETETETETETGMDFTLTLGTKEKD